MITMPQKLYKDSLNCSDQHVITSLDNSLLNNIDHFAVIFRLCMYIQLKLILLYYSIMHNAFKNLHILLKMVLA